MTMGETSSVYTTGTNATNATSATKKKRRKSILKSIKGMSIRRKKRSRDEDTVTAMEAPRQPAAPALPARPAAGRPIQVVLLLMDPSSRRFELLQLEFDSNKALVADVLRQVRSSASEKSLRAMNYVGVCDASGSPMAKTDKLAAYCQGNELVMAIPPGMAGSDTAALARPILTDGDVINKLRPHGVRFQPQPASAYPPIGHKDKKMRQDRKTKHKSTKPPAIKSSLRGSASSSVPISPIFPMMALLLFLFSIIYLLSRHHADITQPIASQERWNAGDFRANCGIWELLPPISQLPPKLSSLFEPTLVQLRPVNCTMLEMGQDGILRYFEGDDRRLEWSFGDSLKSKKTKAGIKESCSTMDNGECSTEEENLDKGISAVFLHEGGDIWSVTIGGAKTTLTHDIIANFF